MTLRDATAADLQSLVELNAHVQSLHAAAHPSLFKASPDPTEARTAFAALLAKPGALWALATEDEPAGYLYAEMQERAERWSRPAINACYINPLVVAPRFRRRGVAKSLVDFAVTAAATRGIARVELDVWSFNTEAKHCFASLGFEVFNEKMVMKRHSP